MSGNSEFRPASAGDALGRPESKGDAPNAGPLAVARAVFWAFLGIRKKSDYAADAISLKPKHVIIAGIIGGILFVLTLIIVVRIVTAN